MAGLARQVVNGPDEDTDDRMVNAELFVPLDLRFGFTIDVAAAEHNARCARFYDRAVDGLAQSWAGEVVWCNPPHSAIAPWVRKAWAEHARASAIVLLLPANRTDQRWWQAMVEPFRDQPRSPLTVEFFPGRPKFHPPGRMPREREHTPFGCCLLVWQALTYRPDDV